MSNDFLMPRYDAGGFAGLPGHISAQLGSGKYEAVCLFLVDGFGWRFLEEFQETPFLRWAEREGSITKLTSQFPSTTAAHLTTLHTSLPVGEHGIFEWIYYEPDLDALIAPLLFSFAGTSERDTLKPAGVKPRRLLPTSTFYHLLKKGGVASTILQHREYTPSTYSNIMFAGATARGYRTLAETLVNLSLMVAASKPPAYFVLYYDRIDAVCHEYGPNAPQTEAEILTFLMTMEQVFLKAMASNQRKIICLLTADHGHVETDPATTIYLNRDPRFAGLEAMLRKDKQGKPIIPAGSPRDFFLYIEPGQMEAAEGLLKRGLEGKAEVRRVPEMIEAGFFGPVISPALRARAGDLVILPYAGESVWWYEKDRFEQRFRGHHGGLTPAEMEIPLLMWEMM